MATLTFCADDDEGDEDPSFLSAVAEAEAESLRRLSAEQNKRYNLHDQPCESVSSNFSYRDHTHGLISGTPAKRLKAEPEGEYLAALRGTHSETWQAMANNNKIRSDGRSKTTASSSSSSSFSAIAGFDNVTGGGSCFHCGKDGHWARDCPDKPVSNVSRGSDNNNMPQVADKQCPCGAGMCKVLTANTEKNNGRQFYKCPLRKEEGQCGFFEWCDAPMGITEGTSRDREQRNVQYSELPCPCGAGPCAMMTAKTEKNMGRQFFKCPLNQGEGSCGFFKWCDDNSSSTPASLAYGNPFQERSAPSPQTASGQCYKCGMGGHWAKDCTNPVNQNVKVYANNTKTSNQHQPLGSATTGVTCYKCGQVGHWANTCGMNPPQLARGIRAGSNGEFPNGPGGVVSGLGANANVNSGGCFKCGEHGHWSRDCPGVSNARINNNFGGQCEGAPFSGKTTNNSSSRNCFKCGGQGHWANQCTGEAKGRGMH